MRPGSLTPELWHQVEELFHRALERPADDWQPWLDEACAGNPLLRSEVASLLAALKGPEAFSELAASDLASDLTESEAPPFPERLGPYRLLEVLGEGGMSTVYLAEQSEPLPRRVALKLMRWGGARGRALRRFELERETLARMGHPNIAQVFGAGATEHGQPYVVIEYVPGPPITEFCDRHGLTIEQRLSLFVAVCDGVRHAHEKAVIHRDLKPSNILVSEAQDHPTPKIIDFGIAKSLEPWSDSAAQMTLSRLRVGSPGYMSPEAILEGGAAVDTRSDIYSLGIVLCQLLIGVRPFDTPPGLLFPGLVADRADPARPSERLTSLSATERRNIAELRGTSESRLLRRLSGELDWIILRAIAQDPAARYSSVAELAADIERWLGGRPVEAKPPSLIYRAHKAIRRHMVAFGAGGLIALTVVGFSIRSNMLYRQAQTARTQAEELVSFMLDDLSGQLEPMGRLDMLESVARRSLGYFETTGTGSLQQAEGRPGVALRQIGQVLTSKGDLEAAIDAYERALALDRRRHQAEPAARSARLALAQDLRLLGMAFDARSETTAAIEHLTAAATLLRALSTEQPDDSTVSLSLAITLRDTAALYRHQGNVEQAIRLFEEARAILRELNRLLPDDLDTLKALADLHYGSGLLNLFSLDDPQTAVAELEQGATILRELTAEHPDASLWRYRLAVVIGQGLVDAYRALDRLHEAEAANREALAILDVLVRQEPAHNRWAHALGWELIRAGSLAQQVGDLEAAAHAYQRSVDVHKAVLERSTGRPNTSWLNGLAMAYDSLADAEERQGRFTAALDAAHSSQTVRRQALESDERSAILRIDLATTVVHVGELQRRLGNTDGVDQAVTEAQTLLAGMDESLLDEAFLREQLHYTRLDLQQLSQPELNR